jgi:hypothetical protein
VLLDTNDSLQIRYKPTVIDSDNAVYLGASLYVNENYTMRDPSYLIASKQAEIKGNVFLDYYTNDDNTEIEGFSKVGTMHDPSYKIRINIKENFDTYTIWDGIILTDYPVIIDEIDTVISHLDTSLIPEEWAINEDGYLENIRQ